jgi:hypothetical protein
MEVKVGKKLATTKKKMVKGQHPKKIDYGRTLVNVR